MIPFVFLALGTGCLWFGWYSFKENAIRLKFGNILTRAEHPFLFLTLCLIFLLTGSLFFLGAVGLTLRSTRTLPLRGTVLDQRLDFPSLSRRAASAALVSFDR